MRIDVVACVAAALLVFGGGLLSPAYLVHGRSALVCSVFGCAGTAARDVGGHCHEDWQLVREVFAHNVQKRAEDGGAVAVYFRGELVVDLWGGRWASERPRRLRSYGGVGGLAVAKLIEDGHLDVTLPVSSLWPGYRAWAGPSDLRVDDVLRLRFSVAKAAENAEAGNRGGGSGSGTRPQVRVEPLRSAADNGAAAAAASSFYPYVRDVVVAEIVRSVDPKKRSLAAYVREEIAAPLGLSEADFAFLEASEGAEDSSARALAETSFIDPAALFIRTLFEQTDAWCGAFPLRRLFHALVFDGGDARPGLADYFMYRDTLLGRPLPSVRATARGLARVYSAVSAGDAEARAAHRSPAADAAAAAGTAVPAHPLPALLRTRAASSCVARNVSEAAAPNDVGQNVSVSACGFSLTAPNATIFGLKETDTHGRNWMHFSWANLGGSFAAGSIGHDISVAYLVCFVRGGSLGVFFFPVVAGFGVLFEHDLGGREGGRENNKKKSTRGCCWCRCCDKVLRAPIITIVIVVFHNTTDLEGGLLRQGPPGGQRAAGRE